MVTKTKRLKETDGDYVRMYYEHQYDRVARLESLRLSITNVVITLSVVSFTFSFSNNQSNNLMSGVVLPTILVVSNIFAIVYIYMTLRIIRAHLDRAKITLGQFAPALHTINDENKPPKWTDRFNLATNQIIFHVLLIVLSSLPIWMYYQP